MERTCREIPLINNEKIKYSTLQKIMDIYNRYNNKELDVKEHLVIRGSDER